MRIGSGLTAGVASLFWAVSPALASSGIPSPEPADFALFAAGVIGLLIGRRSSRARRP